MIHYCDKAWHGGDKVVATTVLRCADCGKVYARCEECQSKGPSSAQMSMRAHQATAHQRSPVRRRHSKESFAWGHELDMEVEP